MGTIADQFGFIVEERLMSLKSNIHAAEVAAGLPPDAIRNVIRSVKRSGPTLSRVEEICDALGLELYIGPPRDPGPVEQIVIDGTDYAQIPVHEADLAAGAGAENPAEHLSGHLAFRRSWLTHLGVSPASAVLARACGESMAPTIHDRDMLLIDRSKAAPPSMRSATDKRLAPIYALLDEGAARVKRLERVSEDTLALLSDCSAHPTEIRPITSLSIIGKVVWWGHINKD